MQIDFGPLLSAMAGLLTALTGMWALRAKLQSDRQAGAGDRIARLEEKVDKLYSDLDQERRRLQAAETLTHRFRLGLITAVNQLEEIYAWIRSGAKPPPPSEARLDTLKALIDTE